MSTPRLRTLVVSMMSYPPVGGELLRNWQNINIMTRFGPVGVFSVFDRDSEPGANGHLSFWHHHNTARDRSLRAWAEAGLQWVRQCGLTYYCSYRRSAAQDLERLLGEFEPDLVVFEQLWVYPYLPVVLRHGCPFVLDQHNIEAPLYRDTKATGEGLRPWVRRTVHVPRIRAAESEFVHRADQVWLCSREDVRTLHELYGDAPHGRVVPNGVDVDQYADARRLRSDSRSGSARGGPTLLYLGNFEYLPNAEAARLLIREIFPALRRRHPEARLVLVGRGATPAMREAAQQSPGIEVTGQVEDVRPHLARADMMVVPLRTGGGTRFKILEAFAAGCPVISTTKGVEGLDAEPGTHLLRLDASEEIVEGVCELWADRALRERIAASALQRVTEKYSWSVIARDVEKAVAELPIARCRAR